MNYDYWPDSMLKNITHPDLIDTDSNGSGDADAEWDFAFTPANQVESKALPNAFQWQPSGGQVGLKQYAANGLNQYDSVDTVPLDYDDNGNLVTDGTWTYTYDPENRMTRACDSVDHTPSACDGATKDATYVFDPLDRRIAKTVNSVTTTYLWAGQNIIAEYDGSTLLRRYIHGAGVDEPVTQIEYSPGSAIKYFHQDHLGTVVALSDSSGDLDDTYSYSPHGEVGAEGVQGSIWRYTGRQLDAETGLYYYRARMYSSQLGRFMQTDPARDTDSLNLMQYALWDPIQNKDPTGLYMCEGSESQCNTFAVGLGVVQKASISGNLPAKARETLGAVGQFYGEAGHDNGVKVTFGSFEDDRVAQADVGKDGTATITIDLSNPSFEDNGSTLAGAIAHEGVHGIDGRKNGGNPVSENAARETETNAYAAQAFVAKGLNAFSSVWNPIQGDAGMKTAIPQAVQKSLDLRAIQCRRTGGCK